MEKIKILIYILLIIIAIYDLRKMIIPDIFLMMVAFLIFLYKLLFLTSYTSIIKGMSLFSFPLFIILLIELHINKELIGLGDIKLIILIGAFFGEKDVLFIHNFYFLTYFLAMIYILLMRKKVDKYIPFAPMLVASAIFFDLYYIDFFNLI